MACFKCNMQSINGIPCHETGCPNTPKGKCASCGEILVHIYNANDWDGIPLCKECAETQAEHEQQQCPHDERDHGICLDCGDEEDPGAAIDRAMDSIEDR